MVLSFALMLPLFLMTTWYDDVAPGYARSTLKVAEVAVNDGVLTWSVAPTCPVGVILIISTAQLPVAVPVPLIVSVVANDAYAIDAAETRTIASDIILFLNEMFPFVCSVLYLLRLYSSPHLETRNKPCPLDC